jgi:hypothetical protein
MKFYLKIQGVFISDIFLLLIVAIYLNGCTPKIITPKVDTSAANMAKLQMLNLIIFEPIVSYEKVNTSEAFESSNLEDEKLSLQTSITQLIRTNLSDKKVRSIPIAEFPKKDKISEISELLKPHIKSLVSAFRSKDEALPILNKLHAETGFDAIVFSRTFVKVGSSGGFDPIITGRVWGSTHSIDAKIVVTSLNTGQQIWYNEALVRNQLSIDSLKEIFSVLFNNSTTIKEVSND